MGSRSHLVGKGAMREHLAYQQSVRRSVRAAAALTDMLGGVPPPCKACKGKHVAHTCGKAKAKQKAGKKTSGATAARLNTGAAAAAGGGGRGLPTDRERMHVIDDEQQLGAYFDGTGRQEAVRREREAQRAASEQQAAAAAAAEAAASNELLTVQAIMQSSPIKAAARPCEVGARTSARLLVRRSARTQVNRSRALVDEFAQTRSSPGSGSHGGHKEPSCARPRRELRDCAANSILRRQQQYRSVKEEVKSVKLTV